MSASVDPKSMGPAVPPAVAHSLETAISESQQALAAEAQKAPKRTRGRPRKASDGSSPQNPQTSPQAVNPVTGAPMQSPPNISEFLEYPLIALSKGPAKKYDIPELALSPEEAKACAVAFDKALSAFIPDVNNMSPKTAAVIACFTTIGSIGFTKYSIFAEVMAERRKLNPPEEPTIQDENANMQKTVGVPAESYFGR